MECSGSVSDGRHSQPLCPKGRGVMGELLKLLLISTAHLVTHSYFHCSAFVWGRGKTVLWIQKYRRESKSRLCYSYIKPEPFRIAQTEGRELMKWSCQRHFVFTWDKSHWNVLKHYNWPVLHSTLQDCSSSCVRAKFFLEGVAALCDSTGQTKGKYKEISIEFKSNKYGHKSTFFFPKTLRLKNKSPTA